MPFFIIPAYSAACKHFPAALPQIATRLLPNCYQMETHLFHTAAGLSAAPLFFCRLPGSGFFPAAATSLPGHPLLSGGSAVLSGVLYPQRGGLPRGRSPVARGNEEFERPRSFFPSHGTHTVASRSCICVGLSGRAPRLFMMDCIRADLLLQVICMICNTAVTIRRILLW